jgi:hypothetical protein
MIIVRRVVHKRRKFLFLKTYFLFFSKFPTFAFEIEHEWQIRMANPNGKKGSQKHQDVQKAEKKKVTEEFSEQTNVVVETEVPVATPNGKKNTE